MQLRKEVVTVKRVGVLALGLCLMFCLTACGVQITGISLPESLELEAGASETLEMCIRDRCMGNGKRKRATAGYAAARSNCTFIVGGIAVKSAR